jgi:hypothetical protein
MRSLLLRDRVHDLGFQLLDGGDVLNSHREELGSLEQTPRVVLELKLDLSGSLRDRETEHVEGVERDAHVATLGALDPGFELSVEQVNK